MTTDIFISVGRRATEQQERFVTAIERFLRQNGLSPCRAEYSAVQPLKKIEEVIETCCGTVIIAFERLYADSAVELRGSPKPRNQTDVKVTTVWNQLEAALAYSRGHPLLVICEDGLRREGLLEKGYDWAVQWINMSEDSINSPEFRGIFDDWKMRVEKYHGSHSGPVAGGKKGTSVDLAAMSVGEIISAARPSHLWSALVALMTLLVTVAGTSYQIGYNMGRHAAPSELRPRAAAIELEIPG